MTEADRVQIKSLWDNGLPIEQIVRMLPYTPTEARSIINLLRTEGELPPRHKKRIGVKKLGNAYISGITDIDELATMFGYTRSTVIEYLKYAGIKRERPKKYRSTLGDTARAITEDIMLGEKSLYKIASEHGVSRQYVHQLKRRLEADGGEV